MSAYNGGQAAHANGQPRIPPYADPGTPVGDPGYRRFCDRWLEGWDAAALAAGDPRHPAVQVRTIADIEGDFRPPPVPRDIPGPAAVWMYRTGTYAMALDVAP